MVNIYKIVIFGTGNSSERLYGELKTNIEVICYLDNNKSKWGKKIRNKIIYNPEEITNLQYDFVVIASQYNNEIAKQLISFGISKEKIFEYVDFVNISNNVFERKMKVLEDNPFKYESIITGISYFVSGISADKLLHKGINLSFDSQDLYYDYNIVKYILENINTNIKYVIIGLNYYSFEYDLTLSSMKDNVKLYYHKLKKSHHINEEEIDYNGIEKNKKIGELILKSFDKNECYGKQLIPLNKQKELEKLGVRQAELDCKKNYPKTVKENKEIFIKYLKLLEKSKIKPIVVVCPASKYYYENFSKRIENEFKTIIRDIKQQYKFQYIDYFRSEEFDDSLFYDVSHLTYEGGEKFTEILNNIIEW